MALSPFTVERFGGLNTRDDPEEVGLSQATSLLNVDLDLRWRLRTRDGYSNFTSAAATAYQSMYYSPTGQLLAIRVGGASATMEAFDSAGSSLATATGGAGSSGKSATYATIGTPTASKTFIFGGNGIQHTWDGAAFASVSASFTGTAPPDDSKLGAWRDRLVAAGGATNPARVRFSDAGSPLAFNNFVDIDPGDGEAIAVTTGYGNELFIWKATKFYAFYGVSTDSTGQPVFNYRRQTFGAIGPVLSYVEAPEGVYALSSTGLYRTQGGPLSLVSDMPQTIFNGTLSSTVPTGYTYFPGAYKDGRLFFSACASGSSTADRVLVYDTRLDAWLVWNVAALALAVTRYSNATSLKFAVPSLRIVSQDTSTTDAGSAIAWNWTSGLADLSGKNCVSITLESAVWGTGTVTLQVANDHGSVDTGSALTLGASPAIAQTFQQIDREGTFWQHKLSGSGAAVVNRVVHYISFVKPAGVG